MLKRKGSSNACAICQSEMKNQKDIITIPCGHSYHKLCYAKLTHYEIDIKRGFRPPRCPVCRAKLLNKNVETVTGKIQNELNYLSKLNSLSELSPWPGEEGASSGFTYGLNDPRAQDAKRARIAAEFIAARAAQVEAERVEAERVEAARAAQAAQDKAKACKPGSVCAVMGGKRRTRKRRTRKTRLGKTIRRR